jgi:hypothetical protein
MEAKSGPLTVVLRYALLVGAGAYLVVSLWLAWQRVPYPYELEWMEGGCVDAVQRILDGKSIYPEPSTEFIPFLYTPAYFYVSAAVAELTGIGYLPLRLTAYVALLGCLGMIWALVRRETGDGYAGALGALLFVAMYELTGSWFDVSRADSLYLLVQLVALFVLRFHSGTRGGLVLAGVLFFAAFFTKQTALFVGLAAMGWSVLGLRWRAAWFIAPFVGLVALSSLAMQRLTDGWYVYYVFETPQTHPIWERYMFGLFWTDDLGKPLFAAIAVTLVYLLVARAREHASRSLFAGRFFWAPIFLGLLVAGWWVRGHTGSFNNIVIPTYAAVALGFGMGIATVLRAAAERPGARGGALAVAIYVVALFQFAWLGFDPRENVPTAEQWRAGDAFVAALAKLDGEVFVPAHPYLPTRAGKTSSSHLLSMKDCFTERVERELLSGIRARRWSAIVLERRWEKIDAVLAENYVEKGPLIDVPLRPMTGLMPRMPPTLWTPRPESDE